jgi:hypothetical protein
MRQVADQQRIRDTMRGLADAAREPGRAYLTGGTTAVLLGWRASTIDVDVKFVPDQDEVLRAIPTLKERLQVNIELASPADFIPVPPGWEERSVFVDQIGQLAFFHFDPYAQALAKLERGHTQDVNDVRQMVRAGLVKPERALAYFDRIEPDLYRFPAIHAPAFRDAVRTFFTDAATGG